MNGIVAAATPVPALEIDKWQVFRELTVARDHFGLSSRSLTVLNALLSFLPGQALCGSDPIIVFPSNRSLGERAHGMAEATSRRHLAALIEAGFLTRHDSPNGKRYSARDRSGAIVTAYGFDLRPLLVRAPEILEAAEETRLAQEALKRQREAVVLLVRDAGKLIDYGQLERPTWDWASLLERLGQIRKLLRRKLDAGQFGALETVAAELLSDVETVLADLFETPETSGSDSENERHYQSSDKDLKDSEKRVSTTATGRTTKPAALHEHRNTQHRKTDIGTSQDVSLEKVLEACPSFRSFSSEKVDSWQQMERAAHQIRPWLGISVDTWDEACREMGAASASICIAGILERQGDINSPGAYLRALTQKSRARKFSPVPMLSALLNRQNRIPAHV